MKQNLYTLAIGHLDRPAAEIFTSERAALARRIELAEVGDDQRTQILRLFDSGDAAAYELALNKLESEASLVCSIEGHDVETSDRRAPTG